MPDIGTDELSELRRDAAENLNKRALRHAAEELYRYVIIEREGHANAPIPQVFVEGWNDHAATIVAAYITALPIHRRPVLSTITNAIDGVLQWREQAQHTDDEDVLTAGFPEKDYEDIAKAILAALPFLAGDHD